MSNPEIELLSWMTTPEGVKLVAEKRMSVEVFEDPRCRDAYVWALDYFRQDQQPPTRKALEHKFPGVVLNVPGADGSARWTVEQLQERYAINRVQQLVRSAATRATRDKDPFGALDELYEAGREAKARAGRTEEDLTGWVPVDLGPYLRGEIVVRPPCLGIVRSDGVRLIYPGREHSVIGETGAGKSWFAVACAAAEIAEGNRVLYIHYEEPDPTITVERLLLMGVLMGVDPAEVEKLLTFVGPKQAAAPGQLTALLDPPPSLVIHDGVNEGMALHGQLTKEVEGASDFRQKLVIPCLEAGAATLACDHYPISHDDKRRDAYGSGHKGNALSGARFSLENVEPFGQGVRGYSLVYVTKDRPGRLSKDGMPGKTPGKIFLGTLVVDTAPRLVGIGVAAGPYFELSFLAPTEDDRTARATQGRDRSQERAEAAVQLRNAIHTVVFAAKDHRVKSQARLFALLRQTEVTFTDDDARNAIEDLLVEVPPRFVQEQGRGQAKSYRATEVSTA